MSSTNDSKFSPDTPDALMFVNSTNRKSAITVSLRIGGFCEEVLSFDCSKLFIENLTRKCTLV